MQASRKQYFGIIDPVTRLDVIANISRTVEQADTSATELCLTISPMSDRFVSSDARHSIGELRLISRR